MDEVDYVHSDEPSCMRDPPSKDFVLIDLWESGCISHGVDEVLSLHKPVEVVSWKAVRISETPVVISKHMVSGPKEVAEPVLKILFFDQADAVDEYDYGCLTYLSSSTRSMIQVPPESGGVMGLELDALVWQHRVVGVKVGRGSRHCDRHYVIADKQWCAKPEPSSYVVLR